MSIVASQTDPVVTSPDHGKVPTWHRSLRRAVRDPVELCRAVDLPRQYDEAALAAARQFPVFVPWEYIARIRPGDVNDPLLRQVLPLNDELHSETGFSDDPVGDSAATLAPGLLRKYSSRVLLITTGTCAVHCRYCFRRHFPFAQTPQTAVDWEPALQRIAEDPSVEEVILSGGDPLTVRDDRLDALVVRLEKIVHLQRLRIHTRLPIMIPSRVNDQLLGWLRSTRLVSVVVIHANHANELDDTVADSLARLVDSGIPVLNQAVLLRGVNDNAEALVALSRRLVDLRVIPYYLHQLDPVRGASHFEVPQAIGVKLVEEMRARLPGYAVPRYVREVPGGSSKEVIA